MPGKTKHFQTLKLIDNVTLCDCPGLVFPKVHASKAEMILSGLYPIDTLKEFH
jgi:large subunit GTPase 1